jgi:hypothetical protein
MTERLFPGEQPPDEPLFPIENKEDEPNAETSRRFKRDTERALQPVKRVLVKYVHGTIPGTQTGQLQDENAVALVRHEYLSGDTPRVTSLTIINDIITPKSVYVGKTFSLHEDRKSGNSWTYDSPVYVKNGRGLFIPAGQAGEGLSLSAEAERIRAVTSKNIQGVTDKDVITSLQQLHQIVSVHAVRK